MKKKFKLTTLGCRTNQYETEAFRTQLLQMGCIEAKEDEKADLCIINTCTVTASADSSSRHKIREAIEANPSSEIVVTGCFVENNPHLAKEIEGISHLIRNSEKDKLVATLFPELHVEPFLIDQFSEHTRAFVKVQDGCNSFCSYCIIPYVRGRSRSRGIEEVVQEVRGLVANGYKEVVITGINVGDFEGGLAKLIRAVDAVEGISRVRLSSIDPDEVDEELLEAIVGGKHTCPSMHIVLQAGSNVVLKRMRRKYSRHCFMETIEKLKKRDQDFTFTTDVIVGFPGETERDFEETVEVIEEVEFAKVHMFPYSKRERTKAALFPDQLPQSVIRERKERLLRIAEKSAYRLRERFVAREMEVLVESDNRGHTSNFLPVTIEGRAIASNELVKVKLTHNTPMGLIAL